MTPSERTLTEHDDGIDLIALSHLFWDYKYLILLACGACGLAAAILAFSVTPIYRAEVVIALVRDGGMGGAASLANQLGGLASLAGLNSGAGGDLGQERQAILESRRLVEEFIKRHALLPRLFSGSKQPPTLWFGVERFKRGVLVISQDKRTGMTRVAIDWTDPKTAASWANDFVALANDLIRAQALAESSRNIAYLNDQLARTNVVEVRSAIYNLIENETKTLMLANGRSEYAFAIVDPAVPPETRTSPHRTIMVSVGLGFGFLIGAGIAFLHSAARSRRGARQSP